MRGQIILSHGSDSGPGATKISALADWAEALGWRTQRPDFRVHDGHGYAAAVAPRVAQLCEVIAACEAPPVLVGSSMGAFASALASLEQSGFRSAVMTAVEKAADRSRELGEK